MFKFYEFFAGGGMARAGLGAAWECLFANDIDLMKAETYRSNWDGADELSVKSIADVSACELPGQADLAWASFPCQDLSLAGAGAGLGGERSGTFWAFWRLIRDVAAQGRAPRLIVLENVVGALHSHDGEDFTAICSAFSGLNYRFGAMVLDAKYFLPQSRPRLFVVAAHGDVVIPADVRSGNPDRIWHPKALVNAYEAISGRSKDRWVWWNLPHPPKRVLKFGDLIEAAPKGVTWHSPAETAYVLGLMSPLNLQKVASAKAQTLSERGLQIVGGVYRRTRPDHNGDKQQRAEVRFDDISGCLRTPSGGSSRQTILVVKQGKVRSRLLSPREAARLMGLPDSYKLPGRYNDAYHVAGDGLAVPVVRHLADNLLTKLADSADTKQPFTLRAARRRPDYSEKRDRSLVTV